MKKLEAVTKNKCEIKGGGKQPYKYMVQGASRFGLHASRLGTLRTRSSW